MQTIEPGRQPVGEDRISSKRGTRFCPRCTQLRRTPIGGHSKRCHSAKHGCAGCAALNKSRLVLEGNEKSSVRVVDPDDPEDKLRYIEEVRKHLLRGLGPEFYAKHPEWKGVYYKNGMRHPKGVVPPSGRLTPRQIAQLENNNNEDEAEDASKIQEEHENEDVSENDNIAMIKEESDETRWDREEPEDDLEMYNIGEYIDDENESANGCGDEEDVFEDSLEVDDAVSLVVVS